MHPEHLVRRWTAAEVADFVSGLFGPPLSQTLAGALRHSSVDGDVLLAVVFDGTLPDGVETLTCSGVRLESGGPVPVGVVGAIRRKVAPLIARNGEFHHCCCTLSAAVDFHMHANIRIRLFVKHRPPLVCFLWSVSCCSLRCLHASVGNPCCCYTFPLAVVHAWCGRRRLADWFILHLEWVGGR